MIEGPKSLPGVIAAIGSAHEVFNYQSDVNQADAVVRRQVTLKTKRLLTATLSLCQLCQLLAMKIQTNGKVRNDPRAQLHTHPYVLTPQTHRHIARRNQDNWRRLSDSPWGRSNWTLDSLAWKEHTRSVRQNHIKGTDIPLRPSKSRIRVWCHIELIVKKQWTSL